MLIRRRPGILKVIARNWWRDAVVNTAIAGPLVPSVLRWRVMRVMTGGSIAKSRIESGGWLGGRRLVIETGVFIGNQYFIDSTDYVYVERDVRIGPRVTLCTSTHTIGPSELRGGDGASAPIRIGRGAWLGAGVTVLPGASIGAGTVVAAGAVVTTSCKANYLYAGVPARAVRELPE